MQWLTEHTPRLKNRKALAIAAALLCTAALGQPNLAYAGPHGGGGGGGFHGGGFHGGGFHGGGFHGGGFHGGGFGGFHGGFHGGGFGGFHGDRFAHDGFRDRFHGNRSFFGGSFVNPWWDYYPYYGDYGYSEPYSPQIWYYCSDPAGYYPYVTQCNTGWQTVPAS